MLKNSTLFLLIFSPLTLPFLRFVAKRNMITLQTQFNNRNTRTGCEVCSNMFSDVVLASFLLSLTYFTPFSSAFIANFEQVIADWVVAHFRSIFLSHTPRKNQNTRSYSYFSKIWKMNIDLKSVNSFCSFEV